MTCGQRILEACKLNGVTLKNACETSGVRYGTLYAQISNEREIPFTTVDKISRGLRVPMSFFAADTDMPDGGNDANSKWSAADAANAERAKCCRAGFAVTTDNILDWHRQEGGVLRNWGWFEDQIDLYHPLEPTDRIMKPIQIGKRSLTAERLMIAGNRDFYEIVSKFGKKRIERAMYSHKALERFPYTITEEDIDDVIKGLHVRGGYRKVTMRLTDLEGKPVTAVFSKLTWLDRPQGV